jgi:hypothetical protein
MDDYKNQLEEEFSKIKLENQSEEEYIKTCLYILNKYSKLTTDFFEDSQWWVYTKNTQTDLSYDLEEGEIILENTIPMHLITQKNNINVFKTMKTLIQNISSKYEVCDKMISDKSHKIIWMVYFIKPRAL